MTLSTDDMAEERHSYCSMRAGPVRTFAPGLGPQRTESLIILGNKWVNGTVLHYYFFDRETDGRNILQTDGTRRFMTWTTDEEEKDVVRAAFRLWKNLGIGLTFEEVDDRRQAEFRIGFERGHGYWSFLGRDVLEQGADERTMNFGRNLAQRPNGMDTALHEIGHSLGLPHEHQSPFAGIKWNEEAVFDALALPPNEWEREKTHHNIIRKIPADEVQGSEWDQNSIMHYPFEAGMIDQPEELRGGLDPEPGLSQRDKVWIRTYYPPLSPDSERALRPLEPVPLSITPGEQLNFVIRPEASRIYTIQTLGESDTVIVLFEDIDGSPTYVTADDDGGQDTNAQLRLRLHRGRTYYLRLRLYFRGASGDTAVMMF